MALVSSGFAVLISETGLLADTGLLEDFWLYYIRSNLFLTVCLLCDAYVLSESSL